MTNYEKYRGEYEKEEIYAWSSGRTSWNTGSENCAMSWKYAKLAEME